MTLLQQDHFVAPNVLQDLFVARRVEVDGDIGLTGISMGIDPCRISVNRAIDTVLKKPWYEETDIALCRELQACILNDPRLQGLFEEILTYLKFAQTDLRIGMDDLSRINMINAVNSTFRLFIQSASEDTILNPKLIALKFIYATANLQKNIKEYIKSVCSNGNLSEAQTILNEMLLQILAFLKAIKTIIARLTIGRIKNVLAAETDPSMKDFFLTQTPISFNERIKIFFARFFKDQNLLSAAGNIQCEACVSTGPRTRYRSKEEGQLADAMALSIFRTDIENCFSTFNDDKNLCNNPTLTTYWIELLYQLVTYQNRYKKWMNKAVLSTDGGIRSTALLSPQVAMKQKPEDVVLQPEINIGSQHRLVVITGPNTGGKTELMNAIAQLYVHRQIGCLVFGRDISVSRVGKILYHRSMFPNSNPPITDNPMGAFAQEVEALARIRGKADKETLILLDEVLLGTQQNTNHLILIIEALLNTGARVLMVTHQFDILEKLQERPDTLLLQTSAQPDGAPTYQFTQTLKGFTSTQKDAYHKQQERILHAAGFTTEEASKIEELIEV